MFCFCCFLKIRGIGMFSVCGEGVVVVSGGKGGVDRVYKREWGEVGRRGVMWIGGRGSG